MLFSHPLLDTFHWHIPVSHPNRTHPKWDFSSCFLILVLSPTNPTAVLLVSQPLYVSRLGFPSFPLNPQPPSNFSHSSCCLYLHYSVFFTSTIEIVPKLVSLPQVFPEMLSETQIAIWGLIAIGSSPLEKMPPVLDPGSAVLLPALCL